jgi:hypothetical protein
MSALLERMLLTSTLACSGHDPVLLLLYQVCYRHFQNRHIALQRAEELVEFVGGVEVGFQVAGGELLA